MVATKVKLTVSLTGHLPSRNERLFMSRFVFLVLVVMLSLCAVQASRAAPLFQASHCTAETPTPWICEYEIVKWQAIEVTWSNWTSGIDCNPCHVSSKIKVVSSDSSDRKHVIESVGPTGAVAATGDEADIGHGSSATFSESFDVPCGSCRVHDVSYATGACPTSTPGGPGPCTIAACTYCCSSCSE